MATRPSANGNRPGDLLSLENRESPIANLIAASGADGQLLSDRPRKADAAYFRLKHLILTLQLAPGQALDERDLMETVGTGRTPLREAIQRLSHERLIVTVPRKGSYVAELSVTVLQELIAARRLVEPPVAALAAEVISTSELEALRDLVDRAHTAVATDDIASAIYFDLAFHRNLAIASGNDYLARIVNDINTAALRYWYVSYGRVGGTGSAFAHHYRILEQLEARDPEAVAQSLLDHVEIFTTRMREALAPRL